MADQSTPPSTSDRDDKNAERARSPPRSPKNRRSRSRSPRRRSRSPSRRKSSRDDRGANDDKNRGNTIYVSGLSTRTRSSDLEAAFAKHGKVEKVKLITDPRSGDSRGFAFITMGSLEDCFEAIKKLDRSDMDGRVITVEKSRREKSRSPTPGKYLGRARPGRPSPRERGGGYGYYPAPYYGERERERGGYYRYSPYREGRRRSPSYDRPYDRRERSPYYERERRSRSPYYDRERRPPSRERSPPHPRR